MKRLLILLCLGGTLTNLTAGPLDSNGDLIDDLYFQNSAGQIYSWQLDDLGTPFSSIFVHSGFLLDWRLVARADLNQDGTGDLIFQNSNGRIFAWLMSRSGFAIGSISIYNGDALADWRVVAAADLNRNRIADLILQKTSGEIIGWIMNGTGGVASAVTIWGGNLGPWRVRAAADVNGNGIADLLLQDNQNGQVVALLMNGGAGIAGNVTIYGSDLVGWQLRTAVDLNFDFIPDLVLQNTNGQIFGWVMGNDTTILRGVNVWADPLLDWEVL